MWRGLQDITNYRKSFPHSMENRQLADDLNVFYCRFDHPTFTPLIHSNSNFTQSTAPPVITSTLPPDSPPALTVCEEHACQLFQRQKIRRASGPAGVSPSCLKACADQLAPIFIRIFNRSLELWKSPPVSNTPPSSQSLRSTYIIYFKSMDPNQGSPSVVFHCEKWER